MLKSNEERVVRFLAGNPGLHTAGTISQSVGIQAIVHILRKLKNLDMLEQYPDGRYKLKPDERHSPVE